MKIAILVDKEKSAIHRLSVAIKRHNPHLDIRIVPLHPKRPDFDQIQDSIEAFKWCDVLHIGYWRSGEKLKEFVDIKQKPCLLTHYNPYDINNQNWTETYTHEVVNNGSIHAELGYAQFIPMGIDLDHFEFKEESVEEPIIQMVAGRIEGKKGVYEVAKACKDLGYKFVLIGRISKPEYYKDILTINPDVEFREDVSEDQLRDSYYESMIHICNSADDFESGTLPIMEAMACGTVVVTRNIGHVPDLFDGQNMIVRQGKQDDVEDLKTELKEIVENYPLRQKMRLKAWETIKNYPDKKMARRFEEAYYLTYKKKEDKPFVSVIIPSIDPELLVDALICAEVQSYPYIEIVVVDNSEEGADSIIEAFRKKSKRPVKHVKFKRNGYDLAKARNLGIVESCLGSLIVFSDERIRMDSKAVEEFVKHWSPKVWLYGVKDNAMKGFVENFSCVERMVLIKMGMICERMDTYGGMTQELRQRFSNTLDFELVQSAKATATRAKSKAGRRKDIIESKFKLFKMYG